MKPAAKPDVATVVQMAGMAGLCIVGAIVLPSLIPLILGVPLYALFWFALRRELAVKAAAEAGR